MISSRTEIFIFYVEELVRTHVVKNYAEIADKLEWNRPYLSGVMQRKKNIPEYIYNRFMEIYFPSKILNPLQFLVESQIKLESKVDGMLSVLLEILSILKKEDVFNLADEVVNVIESKIAERTKELL